MCIRDRPRPAHLPHLAAPSQASECHWHRSYHRDSSLTQAMALPSVPISEPTWLLNNIVRCGRSVLGGDGLMLHYNLSGQFPSSIFPCAPATKRPWRPHRPGWLSAAVSRLLENAAPKRYRLPDRVTTHRVHTHTTAVNTNRYLSARSRHVCHSLTWHLPQHLHFATLHHPLQPMA